MARVIPPPFRVVPAPPPIRSAKATAKAVREDLIMRGGIEPKRLVSRGFGKTRMLDKANTAEADYKNRRVSFLILKQKRKRRKKKAKKKAE